MKTTKLLHIIKQHKKKLGIKSYAKNMAHAMRLMDVNANVKNYSEFKKDKNCKYIFHFSNASRPIALVMNHLNKKNTTTVVHDVIPRTKLIPINLYKWLLLYVTRKSNTIVVHTHFAKKMLLGIVGGKYEKKIHVVPHGTVINFKDDQKKQNDKKITFLTIGKVNKSSGIIETIQAFREIPEKNAEWIIIGTCHNEEIMEEANKDNRIKVLGFTSNEIMHVYLKKASALIVNRVKTVGESSGSIAHAIGYGLPVICPKNMSITEMAGDAALHYENTKKSKKIVLKEFIENISLREKLSENAKRLAKQIEFTRTAEKILKLL